MKVASARAAVSDLLEQKTIKPGDTLLDSSSGIYAYALALACHRYGLRCHIVGSTTIDPALRTQLAILGAHLEQMPPSNDLKLDQKRRVARIHEILHEHPTYHWMRQYHDAVHYLGYRAIARAIENETDTTNLTLVGGVGSGASTGALATYLRQHSPGVELLGVQPFGSITFGSEHVNDPDIIIAGIGSSIPFGNVDHTLYDSIHWVGFEPALAGTISLLRDHAIFAGLSTGASYLSARWHHQHTPDRTVLFIAADTGHRYADSVFARHQHATDIDTFAPHTISTLSDLALPWSRMRWNRAPTPLAGT